MGAAANVGRGQLSFDFLLQLSKALLLGFAIDTLRQFIEGRLRPPFRLVTRKRLVAGDP